MTLMPALGAGPIAQQRPYRVRDWQVRELLQRIEVRTGTFRARLTVALNESRIDNTRREDNINQFVRDFEVATTSMRAKFNTRQSVAADVEEVLNRAVHINDFMGRRHLAAPAEREWTLLRSDLGVLARYYGVTWRWDSPNGRNGVASRLNGTYRLDPAHSEEVWAAASAATRGMTPAQQARLREVITRRMQSPEAMGIERNGQTITIASSGARPVTFQADGQTRVEQNNRGRSVRVTASLAGDQLVVSSTGDRGNDFRVTFDPVDNGQRLRVARRLDIPGLSQPVTVSSTYEKTAEAARLDLFTDVSSGGLNRSDYGVPGDTRLVATLNNGLTTRTARVGDRFALTVQSPSQYEGAVLEGYVSRVDHGSRVAGRSEMSFAFERIRMRNGATYDFDGYIEVLRTPNAEDVRVDTEGTVSEKDSQTTRTLTRSGIGAALGAVIGALAGGGKGAAIGAALGAGAGAGSVFVQGRDELELLSGTQFTIRAVTPQFEQ
jgi:hypothetical protein